jgi:FKBP-type peptidyl-prolyl cis-trans isomerase SlyD
LTDTDTGDVLEEVGEDEGLPYLHGHDNIVPGLENELEGKTPGDDFEVTVEPEEAYGERMEELVSKMDRDAFPEDQDLEPGMVFQAVKSDVEGDEASQLLMIKKIVGDEVEVDANHPLAGKTLQFDGSVVDVREATDQELEQGHPTREQPPQRG